MSDVHDQVHDAVEDRLAAHDGLFELHHRRLLLLEQQRETHEEKKVEVKKSRSELMGKVVELVLEILVIVLVGAELYFEVLQYFKPIIHHG